MFITKRWPVNRKAVGTCRTCHIATFTRPPAPAPNTFATRPRYTTCFCSVRRKIRNVSQYKYVLALPSLTISLIFVKRDMQNQNHKRARSLIAAHLRSAANNSAPCSELGSLLARKQCKVTGKLKVSSCGAIFLRSITRAWIRPSTFQRGCQRGAAYFLLTSSSVLYRIFSIRATSFAFPLICHMCALFILRML